MSDGTIPQRLPDWPARLEAEVRRHRKVPFSRGGGDCVIFVADCVPAPSDSGDPPPAADVTAWTSSFVADCEALWNSVADAALGGVLGDCSDVSIQQARVTGPLGGVAQMDVPVRLLSL